MSVTPREAPPAPDDELLAALASDQRPAAVLRDDGPVPRPIQVLVVVAVMAGIALRFVTRSHLWLDEALSANIAAWPIGEIPEALRHDGHPPLYYVLLHLWMQVVGSGDVAVRALSGLLSVATLPLAFLAGRRVGGRLLGWLTVAVFALSPYALRYATETRMYALVSLLAVVGYLLADDIVRRGRDGLGRLAALAAVTAALLWSHYWSMWLVGGTAAVLAIVAFRARVARGPSWWGSTRALAALVVGGLAYVPWLPVMLYQSAHTGTPWAGPMRPSSVVALTLTDLGGGATGAAFTEAQLTGSLLLVLMLLGIFGVARGRRRIELDLGTVAQLRAEAGVIAATFVLAMAAMYATGSTFASRYAATVMPLVLLLVAGGMSRFRDRRILAGVLAGILVLFALGAFMNVRTERTQAFEVAERIDGLHQPGDLVVFCPDQLAPAALRVLPVGLGAVAFPHSPTEPDGWPVDRVDWSDYTARNRVDPAAYARAVVDRAGPGGQVFVVYSGGYKTHQGTCEALVGVLAGLRGNPQMLVSEDGITYYEHESLVVFPGR